MDKSLLRKYIAIKPKGFKSYIWFETEKVVEAYGCFIGKSGWGDGGALTNIKCNANEIDSYIYSDTLQY